jgi:hypothetical protein
VLTANRDSKVPTSLSGSPNARLEKMGAVTSGLSDKFPVAPKIEHRENFKTFYLKVLFFTFEFLNNSGVRM